MLTAIEKKYNQALTDQRFIDEIKKTAIDFEVNTYKWSKLERKMFVALYAGWLMGRGEYED